MSGPVIFPTFDPECGDAERRSLLKINALHYNPTDYDVWVYIVISPTGAQPGMQPTFPIRVYAHNHAYYEAMTSALSVPPGEIFSIAVSSSEISLTWNSNPVYLAVRHT